MTIPSLQGFLSVAARSTHACRYAAFLVVLALVALAVPALAQGIGEPDPAQPACLPDGDVDQDGQLTVADALLVSRQALSLAQLDACQQSIADVFPQPAAPDGAIDAQDAFCIFLKVFGLPSCLDALLPANQPPVVDAGPDQSVDGGTLVALSGRASDPDGGIASYAWEQTGGPAVALTGATGAAPSFTAPPLTGETLTFRLVVADAEGLQSSDEVTVRVGYYVDVSAGDLHACGLRDTGDVVCWGDDAHGQSTPPAGSFQAVSAGWRHTCGIRDTGVVVCWGDDADGQSTPPADPFQVVSAGRHHTCGIRETGVVVCWGDDSGGQSTPPPGVFVSVSAAPAQTCGVRETGAVVCWGDETIVQATPPAGSFRAVTAGWFHACGIRDTGVLVCWGDDDDGQSTPPAGVFVSVSARNDRTCGVRTNRAELAAAAAANAQAEAALVAAEHRAATAEAQAAYAADRADAGAQVVATAEAGLAAAKAELDSAASPAQRAAAQARVAAAEMELANAQVELEDAHTALAIAQVAIDDAYAALMAAQAVLEMAQENLEAVEREHDRNVVCWGADEDGESPPPPGPFLAVSAGAHDTCGVRDTGAVVCWGWDGTVPTSPTVAPQNVTVLVVAANDISVSWDPLPGWYNGRFAVLRYVVTAAPDDDGDIVYCTAESPTAACVIEDLRPGVTYTVVVQAENVLGLGPPSVSAPATAAGLFTVQRVLTTDADRAFSVHAADLDGDGDADVLSASRDDAKIAWYENLGGGAYSAQRVITADVYGAGFVYPVDLDGDGDADLLSTGYNEFAWLENLGGGDFSAPRVIYAGVAVGDVHAADLDGDGDADVLSAIAGANRIAWQENLGHGDFSTLRVITAAADGATSVYAADLDGDGDADVLSASNADDEIAWHENLGGGSFSAERVVIASAANFQLESMAVRAADLDGDGDPDVLATGRMIAWAENLGGGDFSPARLIDGAGANDVHAADLDGDGDADVLSSWPFADEIAWHENLGGGVFSERFVISTAVDYGTSVYAADLDNDGDPDVLSASRDDDTIAWYENLSNHGDDHGDVPAKATLVTALPAFLHGTLESGGDRDVFRVAAGSGTLWVYSNGPTDTYGFVLDADGNDLAADDDGGFDLNFQIEAEVAAGVHYVHVTGYDSSVTGPYTLAIEVVE